MTDLEIIYFQPIMVRGDVSDAVANFSAKYQGFNFRKGLLRIKHEDGKFHFVCNGRDTRGKGISLGPSPVRDEITAALEKRYWEETANG